jgi:hypothetical protein
MDLNYLNGYINKVLAIKDKFGEYLRYKRMIIYIYIKVTNTCNKKLIANI